MTHTKKYIINPCRIFGDNPMTAEVFLFTVIYEKKLALFSEMIKLYRNGHARFYNNEWYIFIHYLWATVWYSHWTSQILFPVQFCSGCHIAKECNTPVTHLYFKIFDNCLISLFKMWWASCFYFSWRRRAKYILVDRLQRYRKRIKNSGEVQ